MQSESGEPLCGRSDRSPPARASLPRLEAGALDDLGTAHRADLPPAKDDIGCPRFGSQLAPAGVGVLTDLALGALDAELDGRREEDVHEIGIELCAATAADGIDGRGPTPTALVAADMGDRVVTIGDGDDACGERDRPAGQATWVAPSVPPLVMTEDAIGQMGVERDEWGEDVGTTTRMGGDCHPVGIAELLVAVMNDVEEGGGDLPDIMEERHALDLTSFRCVEPGRVGEDQCGSGNAAHMTPGVRVIGVYGEEKRLERGGAEALGGPTRIAFPEPGGDERSGG